MSKLLTDGPYEGWKLSGPHLHSEGNRENYHLISPEGKRKTVQVARFIMEEHLGRILTSDETVDHINRDAFDNRLDNLRVISRQKSSSDDAKRVDYGEAPCLQCGKIIKLTRSQHRKDRSKAGPFCSRQCSGRYGAEVGHKKRAKESLQLPSKKYFYVDK